MAENRRDLVLSYYVSIDGKSVDAGNGMRAVMESIDDPEQERMYVQQLWEAGAFLMGRASYDAMKGFWPVVEHPSAAPMNPAGSSSCVTRASRRRPPGRAGGGRPKARRCRDQCAERYSLGETL